MYSLVVLACALIQFGYSQPVHKREQKNTPSVWYPDLVYQCSLNLDHFAAIIIYSVRK